jgi:hypothetical protein
MPRLRVCDRDDAAVYRGEGSSGMARDRGGAVCDAVCGWVRRRRRAKRRDERPEGRPGSSETEEPAESRGDRYWRSSAYSRESTKSKCTSAA